MHSNVKHAILCVDDEQDILDSLYDTFMDTYDVKTALNGTDALDIISKYDIAVVISDQRMPIMTGSALLQEINRIKPRCKKVLLTGHSDINAAVDAINKGSVNKYIHKPWDEQELIETVAHLVKSYDADEFMYKMAEDSKNIKTKIDKWKSQSDSFMQFIESCQIGIAIVDNSENITHINKAGLKTLKYNSVDDIKDKKVDKTFMIDEGKRQLFMDIYGKGTIYQQLQVRDSGGEVTGLQASLTFSVENNMKRLKGILFG